MKTEIDLDRVLELAKRMTIDVSESKNYNIDYDYLKENVPKLYDLILAKSENSMEILEFMVKKLKDGKTTQDKASEQFGTFLAEKYIYPKIDMNLENQGSSSCSSSKK